MRPELELKRLFPGRLENAPLTGEELQRFSEFWDDNESAEQNIQAIGRWVELPDQSADDRSGRDQ